MTSTKKQLANLNRKGYMGAPPLIKKTTVAVVIDEPMLDEIDRTATAKRISRSAEVRYRLEQYEKSWKDSEDNPANYSE